MSETAELEIEELLYGNAALIVAAVNHYDACREAELRAVVAELMAALEFYDESFGECCCEPDYQCYHCRTEAALARAREVQP
jgi:hypothetical protein